MNRKTRARTPQHKSGLPLAAVAMVIFAVAALVLHLTSFPKQFDDLKDAINHVLFFLLGVLGLHILERLWVWKDFRASLGQEIAEAFANNDAVVKTARECGITALYRDRKQAERDIPESIHHAKKRLWLLGISLTRSVVLHEELTSLEKKKAAGVDVKILLMDPLCSPAVFRTLLESKQDTVAEILSSLGSDMPLQRHKSGALYSDVQKAASIVADCQHARLHPCVKFMAHSAICWMVLADDVMYYQPYSFGRGKTGEDHDTIGPFLPVLKIESKFSSYPFDVFEDHFQKVWCTSTTTLDEMQMRLKEADEELKKIATKRHAWLEQACKQLLALAHQGRKHKRKEEAHV